MQETCHSRGSHRIAGIHAIRVGRLQDACGEAREHRFASNVRKSVESGCALSPTGCGERPAGRGLPLRASEAYHL